MPFQSQVGDVLKRLQDNVLGPLEMILFAAGLLLFVWGLVKFLWNIGEGGDQTEGKDHMLWGIIGMTIMISIWGIITLIDNTFNLGATSGGAATDVTRMDPILNFGNLNNGR